MNNIMNIIIRKENQNDISAIRQVTMEAFQDHPYSKQTEHILVEKLREADALTISLVAEVDGTVVGHIAFSPVTINGELCDWYGVGPVSVLPAYQRQGIGSMLINTSLAKLRELGAKGCALVGDPEYYKRFGFRVHEGLTLEGVPPEYFLALPFTQENIQGQVVFHKAFKDCG